MNGEKIARAPLECWATDKGVSLGHVRTTYIQNLPKVPAGVERFTDPPAGRRDV